MTDPNFPPATALFAPFQTASALAAAKTRKLLGMQLSSLETYFSVGVNQARALIAVNSPEDFEMLAGKQAELIRLLSEKAIVDMQQFVLLGSELGAEMQQLFDSGKTKAVVAA